MHSAPNSVLLLGGNGLAEALLNDTFENGSLAFTITEEGFDYHEMVGIAETDFTRIVKVGNFLWIPGTNSARDFFIMLDTLF
jgi:hypothetical protein